MLEALMPMHDQAGLQLMPHNYPAYVHVLRVSHSEESNL
jgi:hypothetical protein